MKAFRYRSVGTYININIDMDFTVEFYETGAGVCIAIADVISNKDSENLQEIETGSSFTARRI